MFCFFFLLGLMHPGHVSPLSYTPTPTLPTPISYSVYRPSFIPPEQASTHCPNRHFSVQQQHVSYNGLHPHKSSQNIYLQYRGLIRSLTVEVSDTHGKSIASEQPSQDLINKLPEDQAADITLGFLVAY